MANKDRQKDQEMAQMLKARGEERTTARCPICYGSVAIGFPQAPSMGMHNHLLSCPGPRSRVPRVATRRAA